jgi:hypothetical protein
MTTGVNPPIYFNGPIAIKAVILIRDATFATTNGATVGDA